MHVDLHQFFIGPLGQTTSFSHSELRRRREGRTSTNFAIYVFRDDVSILYVGESSNGAIRPMTGLKCGFAQTGAYRWRRTLDLRGKTIECLVFSLSEPLSFFSANKPRRALEAEVTFAIRTITGAWPRKMTEIHFSEEFRAHPRVVDSRRLIIGELDSRRWLPESERT